MYAVIFKAVLKTRGGENIKTGDNAYLDTAMRLRERARQAGCTDFVSLCEGEREITISYWPSLDHIKQWKQNSEHLMAQKVGKSQWYQSYTVEVVQIQRQYSFESV